MSLPKISLKLRRMDRKFYSRKTSVVARELIGKYVVKRGKGMLIGRIVEVEAYGGSDDP
ncbi:MAG: DNA-3-methyladenine glycosylase, partial [Nitrososphaerales archaeon]